MSTKMEQPFYHDDSLLYMTGHPDSALSDYKLLKPSLGLNLNAGQSEFHFRNHKAQLAARANPEATSGYYDTISSLRLASPDLERLIIQNANGVITTTPSPVGPDGQYFYQGRGITEAQEGFADGFVKALDELHKMNHPSPPNVSIGGPVGMPICTMAPGSSTSSTLYGTSLHPDSPVYTNLTTYSPSVVTSTYPTATISYLPQPHFASHSGLHAAARGPVLKEELQTVPDCNTSSSSRSDSPSMSPIDMENQERIKAERKRLRNRLAATKCRKRKLERIARLEEKVRSLKTDNAGLSSTASQLREQVAQLKQKVLNHVNSGCQLVIKPHAF